MLPVKNHTDRTIGTGGLKNIENMCSLTWIANHTKLIIATSCFGKFLPEFSTCKWW